MPKSYKVGAIQSRQVDDEHTFLGRDTTTSPPINPDCPQNANNPNPNHLSSMPSSNSNPLNSFMAQFIQDKAPPTASVSLVTDNARITRVDDNHFSTSFSAQHQMSRWNETKSSTSVPRAPVQTRVDVWNETKSSTSVPRAPVQRRVI
jgi:hypothetical protein